jgi:HK97 family phage major capsid protein
MQEKLKDLRDKLGRLVTESRVLMDDAEKETREFRADEEEVYQRLEREISQTEKEVEKVERQIKLEERETYLEGRDREPIKLDPSDKPGSNTPDEKENPLATREYRSAWRKYVASGKDDLNQYEIRALSMGVAGEGGYTVPQEQFVKELLQKLDDMMPMRKISRGFLVTQAQSLGAPVLDTDPSDPDWTSELGTGSEDTAMAFVKRELNPYPLAKRIKVSNKLLRASALPIDDIIQERMAYKLYTVLETAYMTGDGSSKPLGIFTASDDGISTGRDVDIGDGAGAYDPDDWITARYTLRSPYWANARWLFHRNVLAELRRLKDTTGQYLWQPGLAQGVPATFIDLPYTVSEFAPGTVATGNYQAIMGDFRYYWRADALDFSVQRLVELYAETNQTGFIVRGEFDGMPVLEDAFVRCSFVA